MTAIKINESGATRIVCAISKLSSTTLPLIVVQLNINNGEVYSKVSIEASFTAFGNHVLPHGLLFSDDYIYVAVAS